MKKSVVSKKPDEGKRAVWVIDAAFASVFSPMILKPTAVTRDASARFFVHMYYLLRLNNCCT